MGHLPQSDSPGRFTGRRVATLCNGVAPVGPTRIEWDRRGEGGWVVPAGVYLIQAEMGTVRLSRRVVLLP